MDHDGADLDGRRGVAGTLGQKAQVRLPRTVRAVVFDLDGTLLDTEPAYRAAFHAALSEFGVTLDLERYGQLVGLSSTTRKRVLPGMLGQAFPVPLFLDAYYRHRAARLSAGIPLKPGVRDAFYALEQSGLPFGVATSASAATAHAHLSRAGLLHRLAAVVTRDDVAFGKPAPDSFIRAAALLGEAPTACLAVEDSPAGVMAAYDAQMPVALIPDTVVCGPEIIERCAARLTSLHELAPLLALPVPELTP